MSELLSIDTTESLKTATKIKKVFEPYKLVSEDDKILYEFTNEFVFGGSVDAVELAERLKETLKVHRAFGLAAPQCGFSYRVFVIGAEQEYIVAFNPKLIKSSIETLHMEEGCLSFPFLTLSITRPKEITVQYQNEFGELIEREFNGITARIFLHEFDHLNGVTFNKVAKPMSLKMGLKRREKQIKQFAREIMRNVSRNESTS
nr:MAG: peptide deformylase [Caudoviricetes sp.]